MTKPFDHDVVVIGGGGHVGLPLSIALADRAARVVIYDLDARAVETINAGRLPFLEPGAEEPLRRALASGALQATTEASAVATAENVVVVIGTPVDEHLNPDPSAVPRALGALRRSTSATASSSCCAAPSTRA